MPETSPRRRRPATGDVVSDELFEALDGVLGRCPDCAEPRILVPVDETSLEWCCRECGAAFVHAQQWTAPTGRRTSSTTRVA